MIIRIFTEGQYSVPDGFLDELNHLDDGLLTAVRDGDQDKFDECLVALSDAVRADGTRLPDDYMGSSDAVLPHSGATIAEAAELIKDDGLIPG